MITVVSTTYINGEAVHEMRGLKTDEKPTTNVGNGSSFLEMDGDLYFFDKDTSTWTKWGE